MAFFDRFFTKPTRTIPPGQRVYAVGDVHGRFDLLDKLLGALVRDNAARRSAETETIFLGDLVDRGHESRAVVELVRRMCAKGGARLLKGNHEEVFVAAARGDVRATRALLGIGGSATLRSYGLSEAEIEGGTYAELAELLVDRIPREDVDFLDRAEDRIEIGDYLFVHAGIRPGRSLAEQTPADLRWIREPFLSSTADHGCMVVHGHTPSKRIEERANRIGIDTGAFHLGTLTAIGLEGTSRWYVQVSGTVGGE